MNTRTSSIIALTLAGALAAGLPAQAQGTTTDLSVTSNFIEAGGGAGSFSMVRAWDNMIGPDALQGALTSLATTYGPSAKDQFVDIFDFAIADAWIRAGMDNVRMPQATGMGGPQLAMSLYRAGIAPNGSFGAGYLLEHLLTPRVYFQVTNDIYMKYGPDAAAQFNRADDQFFEDIGKQLEG